MKKILIFLLFLISVQTEVTAQTRIKHLEPMSWWIGMKNPNLQLLVHGDGISTYKPNIAYKGIKIEKVHQTVNPNYLFIDLAIAPQAKAGEFQIVFESAGKPSITHPYTLRDRKAKSAKRVGFNTSDVIYMITPDRFANGDPTNDSVKSLVDGLNRSNINGRHGGDIAGMINHLDYIASLGMTALWINPMLENAQPKDSYHGYAITDFYQTDVRYGSNADYLKLSGEAQKRNIKLIADMVLNHCGSEHWWMKDLPDSNWINYQNKPLTITNHRRESLHDPYASDYDRTLQSNGWFVSTMPDLNQRNPFLARYLIQNSIWWVENADLKGIRMDTYPYSDKDFSARWSGAVMDEYPDFNIVGEEWSLNPSLVANWQRGKVNQNGYRSNLKSLMDFPVGNSLVEALNGDEKIWNKGWTTLYQTLANDFVYAHPANLVVFADNHDMSRFYTQVHEDFNKFKLGLAFLMTTRGIPQIYYGTEILMSNPKSDAHGEIRGDMPGGWQGDSRDVFNDKGLSAQVTEAKKLVQNLAQWRKGAEVVHTGKLKQFAPENGVYVFFRYNENHKVMVILNKNTSAYTLELAKFREILSPDFSAKDIVSQKSIAVQDRIVLEPGQPMVLDINP
ncbi:MAG: glycoside hydrolase family 13 protein [Dyadobacter sp.]|uniref:glycoside hydrolase family 13 protein n=1 Tax=Dyadobacter sp. TaxID=1914288 RepID=UPI00326310FC